MEELIRCPQCKQSYYVEKFTASTAVYYPPVYKNGVNINPDKNITAHYCRCCNCGNEFTYSTRMGKLYKES